MGKTRYFLKWFTSKVGHLTGISTGTRVYIDHWKSTWWIKLLTAFFVFIILIALCVQFTITPKIPATPANWLYSFLDDWSIVLSASAMVLLAIAAFLTILDNRRARNLDRQERLLNEIIDWATEIQLQRISTDFSSIALKAQALYIALYTALENAALRSEYIIKIADSLNNKLHAPIEDACSKLEICRGACFELIELQKPRDITKYAEAKINLEKSTTEVIKLVTSVKLSLL